MTAKPRSALWVPVFDELADPLVAARLAAEAEELGWCHPVTIPPRTSLPAPPGA